MFRLCLDDVRVLLDVQESQRESASLYKIKEHLPTLESGRVNTTTAYCLHHHDVVVERVKNRHLSERDVWLCIFVAGYIIPLGLINPPTDVVSRRLSSWPHLISRYRECIFLSCQCTAHTACKVQWLGRYVSIRYLAKP